jgi:hypothetical protein
MRVQLGAQDALDELLDALKLVGVDEQGGRLGLEEGQRGFLGFADFAGSGRFDSSKLDKHRGESSLATMPDVLIAGMRDFRLTQFSKNLHDEGESRQRVVDFLCRELSCF